MVDHAMNAPLVSVIILNYNGMQYIERCLKSVLVRANTRYPNFEVVLVDNSSTDGSLEYVSKKFGHNPRLKIIVNNKNYGFAKGNNIGVRHVNPSAKYIVFLNNDTEVDPKWLIELVKVMETDPTIGASQCKLLKMHDRKRIDQAHIFIDFLGYDNYSYGEGENENRYNCVQETFSASGAAFTIRSNIVNEVSINGDLFDPNYFVYYEETDLCWRIRLRNYKIVYIPFSIVYHARGQTTRLRGLSPHLVFHYTKNRIMSLIKNYDMKNILKYIPTLLFLEVIRAVVTLRRRSDHSLATLKGILWVAKNFTKIWKKRLFVQYHVRRDLDSHIMKYIAKPNILSLYRNFKKFYAIKQANEASHTTNPFFRKQL